jgi:hypothetical protein
MNRSRATRALLLVASLFVLPGGCSPTTPTGGTCGVDATVTAGGRPYGGVAGGRVFASPSASLRVELSGAAGATVAWSLTPASGGSITGTGPSADLVVPPAPGTYRITARVTRADGTTCEAILGLEVTEPGACEANQVALDLVTPGSPDVPVTDTLPLAPEASVTLRGTGRGTSRVTLALGAPTDGTLVEQGPGQWTYKAPTAPGEYRLIATSVGADGVQQCRRVVKVTVRQGCTAFRPVTSKAGLVTPFGATPVTVAPGGTLTLDVQGAAPGVTATFTVVEPPPNGTLTARPPAGATYTAPATPGSFTLQASVSLNGQLACTATQPLVVTAPAAPFRRPWPRDYLSIAGTTIVGGSSFAVATINADGTGFRDVGATSTNVGGVAATTSGNVYWSYSPATTTLFDGISPTGQLTSHDSANGNAGMATSDGTSLYYFAYDALTGGVLRKVAPPATSGETVASLPVGDLIGAVTAAEGYVYWGKTLGAGSASGAVSRRATDLSGPTQVVIVDGELNGPTLGVVSVAADATMAYALFRDLGDTTKNVIRVTRADGSGGASQLFVAAPDAVAIAADATHVYWLTHTDAQVRRKLKSGAGSVELLTAVAGDEGWALALDATSVYFTTNDALHKRAK